MSSTLHPREHDLETRVYVAGHQGLVGSAIVRRLQRDGFSDIRTATRTEVDLRHQSEVDDWFFDNRPQLVFLVAGTVGGILANSTRPAEFIYDNLMIHATVVEAARRHQVEKLLYLGSSCIYPREAAQPMSEAALLAGPLEPTNESYAVAKIAGIKLCQAYHRQYGCNFISAMPTNLYGPGDNFDLDSSHVVPALIRKFHEAKIAGLPEATVWGSGGPRREFLHVDDLADCCLFLMRKYDGDQHINVGTGSDLTIRELASLIREVVAPGVEIRFDTGMPDGAPRKLLDVSKLHALGWQHQIELAAGIESTYRWFLEQYDRGGGEARSWRHENVPNSQPLDRRLARVDLLVLDFDGVLTDDRVLVDETGLEAVMCSRSDGFGIERLRASGVAVAVLSKERNPVVAARCKKLGMECHQGYDNKQPKLLEIAAAHSAERDHVAFVGNDLNDLECIAWAGIGVAVADARQEARAMADLVTHRRGGRGAVREICDRILKVRSSPERE